MKRPIYYLKRGVFGQHGKMVISRCHAWLKILEGEFAVYKWQNGKEYWRHKGKWELN